MFYFIKNKIFFILFFYIYLLYLDIIFPKKVICLANNSYFQEKPSFIKEKKIEKFLLDRKIGSGQMKNIYTIKDYPDYVLGISWFQDKSFHKTIKNINSEYTLLKKLKSLHFKTLETYGIIDIEENGLKIGIGIVLKTIKNPENTKLIGNMRKNSSASLTSLKDFYTFMKTARTNDLLLTDLQFLLQENGELLLFDPQDMIFIKNNPDTSENDLKILRESEEMNTLIYLIKALEKKKALLEEEKAILKKIFQLLELNRVDPLLDWILAKILHQTTDSNWKEFIATIIIEKNLYKKRINVLTENIDIDYIFSLYQKYYVSEWKNMIADIENYLFFKSSYGKKILMLLKTAPPSIIQQIPSLEESQHSKILHFIVKILSMDQSLKNFYRQEVKNIGYPNKILKFIINNFKIILINFSQKKPFKIIEKLFDENLVSEEIQLELTQKSELLFNKKRKKFLQTNSKTNQLDLLDNAFLQMRTSA